MPSDRRQHLIEIAYRLFKRDGFHAVGIDRIIAEADVAKMTLYRHFPRKDDLIVAVLDWRADRFEKQLDVKMRTARDPERTVKIVLDWYQTWFRSADFRGCVFQHAIGEFADPAHIVFQAAVRQKESLKRRLRTALGTTYPGARADTIANTLLMLIEGATLMAQMGRGDAAIRDARKAARALLAERPA